MMKEVQNKCFAICNKINPFLWHGYSWVGSAPCCSSPACKCELSGWWPLWFQLLRVRLLHRDHWSVGTNKPGMQTVNAQMGFCPESFKVCSRFSEETRERMLPVCRDCLHRAPIEMRWLHLMVLLMIYIGWESHNVKWAIGYTAFTLVMESFFVYFSPPDQCRFY